MVCGIVNMCLVTKQMGKTHGVLERRENMGVGATLDGIYEVRYLREEWIVIGELVSLLVVVSWSSGIISSRQKCSSARQLTGRKG